MDISNYPAILTNADWQKNKGKIAKIAGETGVGELMKKCEEAYKKIDIVNKFIAKNNIDWRTVPPEKTRDEVVNELEPVLVKKYMAAAAPCRKLLSELRDQAKATATKWSKNALIPKASVQHVEAVSKTADFFFMALKENSDAVKALFDFAGLRADLQKKRDESFKVLHKQISDCENGLKAALKTPTKKVWQDGGAHQGCRSVCNGMAAIGELKKLYYPTWQKFGDFFCKDIPDGDPEEAKKVIAKVKIVAAELNKYKTAVDKIAKG